MLFIKYLDKARQWRWQLRAANHKVIADSGESYINEVDCDSGINLVKGTNSTTPVQRQ
jgi:uncharacterized protein